MTHVCRVPFVRFAGPSTLGMLLALAIVLAPCGGRGPSGIALAQYRLPQAPMELDDKGAVEALNGNTLSLKMEKGNWFVTVGPQTKVNVAGMAEPDFLHSGLFVKFNGEIDKKGALQGELEKVEIIDAPAKMGAFAEVGDDAKPVKTPVEGTSYEFRARVASFKDGVLTASAGNKKIIAKTSPSLSVTVNNSDLSLAQEGDEASVTGWFTNDHRPNFDTQTPGYALGNVISIKLAKPLASAKKARAPAAKKAPRAAKPAAPAAEVDPKNPFAN